MGSIGSSFSPPPVPSFAAPAAMPAFPGMNGLGDLGIGNISTGGIVNGIGGGAQDLAAGFTPTNPYHANTPLNVANLQNQIYTGQGNLANLQTQQQALANQYLAQSQGQGPNPAQAMLNNQTNQNIKQNAGMVASQKGINPALAQRMAGQNAANMNQQAAGQGAVMNAQQQLAAQQGLGSTYGQMSTQNLQNIATSGGLANNSSLGAQNINAGVAGQNAAAQQNTMTGLMSGLGSAATMAFGAEGGEVTQVQPIHLDKPEYKTGNEGMRNMGKPGGGMSGGSSPMASGITTSGGGGGMSPMAVAEGGAITHGGSEYPHGPCSYVGKHFAQGGRTHSVPAMVSPGEKYLSPSAVNQVAQGANPMKAGETIPGKARVPGAKNDYANDTVPKTLQEGGIVLPRSVTKSDHADKKAREFVAAILARKGRMAA